MSLHKIGSVEDIRASLRLMNDPSYIPLIERSIKGELANYRRKTALKMFKSKLKCLKKMENDKVHQH